MKGTLKCTESTCEPGQTCEILGDSINCKVEISGIINQYWNIYI